MSSDDYSKALQAARAEIVKLLSQRADIDTRLAQLKGTVDALSVLVEPNPSEDGLHALREIMREFTGMGISDAIRAILHDTTNPALSPTEIRDELKRRGIKLHEYANEMAVIHNTLTRLEKQGEVVRFDNPSGSVYAKRKTIGQRLAEYGTQKTGMPPPPDFKK
jgi:hypothetical protein